MTALEQLAEFVTTRGIAKPVRANLRRHIVDIAGCWIAAGATPEGRALIRLPHGASIADSVARNCALARLSEIDDIHLASMVTAGAAVIPAAVTLAAALSAKPGDLSDAIVAGYETMIRMGLAIDGPNVLYRGIWPTYFAAPMGVAAVTARLLKLPSPRAAHAMAIAIHLSSPNAGHQHGAKTSRWFAFGEMAAAGVKAALAAKEGFIGNLDILESGFLTAAYHLQPDLEALTKDLGNPLAIKGVSFKPWCAARQTMAGTQALREILASELKPGDITNATIFIPEAHVKMVAHGVAAGDRASHLTSLPYQMALAAYAPKHALDLKQTPKSLPPKIVAFMEKITVRGAKELTSAYPKTWPARLDVETASGSNEVQVNQVPGDPARPFDDEQTLEKFRAIVAPVLRSGKTERVLAQALAVPEKPNAAKALVSGIGSSQKTGR